MKPLITDIDRTGIPKRGIHAVTCARMRYGYGQMEEGGTLYHVADLYEGDKLVAQKLRDIDKGFNWTGNSKTNALFGSHNCRGKGRKLVITEGEIDALSVSQLQDNKWPVVSITKGAGGAAKQLAANLDLLELYDDIVLMFDNDPPGQQAAEDCAAVLPPGRAYIASFELKDANEMLMAGRGSEVTTAMWNAKPWRPEGVVRGVDLLDAICEKPEPGISYPWDFLTKALYGQRKGEMVMWTAGTGIGKTTTVRENVYHVAMKHGEKVGYIGLEDTAVGAALAFVSLHMKQQLHLPDIRENVTDKDLRAAGAEVLEMFEFYNHEGSYGWDALESKIRYWKHSCGIEWIVIDHVSCILAANATSGSVAATDELMTRLGILRANLHIHIDVICQLRKTGSGGSAFEEGGEISLDDLRGSGTLKQVPNIILALERDQQGGDETPAKVRGLKDRFSGCGTGILGHLQWDHSTGWHVTADDPGFEDRSETPAAVPGEGGSF